MALLAAIRNWFKRLYAFVLPIRFTFVALGVLAFALLMSDQGADIIRALVEDVTPGQHYNWRLAAFLIASFLLALELWYWSRHLLRFRPQLQGVPNATRDRVTQPVVEDFPFLNRWLPRVLGLLVFIIEVIAIRAVRATYANETLTRFNLTIGWVIALAVVYLIFVIGRRKFLTLSAHTIYRWWAGLDKTTHVVFVVSVAIEIGLFIWAYVSPVTWWVLGAGCVLVATIAVWIPLGSFLVAFGERAKVPILTLLILWAVLISPKADNHIIRTIARKPVARPTLDDAFAAWRKRAEQLPRHNGKIPAIIVATEGGGIRAAYWTATVLTSLDDQIPDFSKRVFAVSGVSGGALGSTIYDALLARRADGHAMQPLKPSVRTMLQFDALSGTLAALSQPDLFQRFVPFFCRDRARALEEGWERGWRNLGGSDDRFAAGFLEMFAEHPDLPLLFHNGTTVELGDRILTAPVNFRKAPEFRNAHDAMQYFGDAVDLRLSTAAHNSARFTYISPAGIVPNAGGKRPFGHVVDGGYFEVSGAVTASELVAWLKKDPEVEPWVVVIDYWKTQCPTGEPYCPAYGPGTLPPPPKVERWANEVLSPLRAVLAARDARGLQAVGDITQQMRFDDGSRIIEFRLVQGKVPLPLGWVLSNRAMDAIDVAMDRDRSNVAGVSVLKTLLAGGEPPRIDCDAGSCRTVSKGSVYTNDD